MSDESVIGVTYFRREDYQRIRAISDDDLVETFDEFEAKLAEFFARTPPPGIRYQKVLVDPDELLAFADRFSGGKINAATRSDFAAWKLAQNDRRG